MIRFGCLARNAGAGLRTVMKTRMAEPPPPSATHGELMAQFGIAHNGESYIYGQYRYSKLEDAVAYARQQKA